MNINRSLIDQLGDVRERIRELQEREKELRVEILRQGDNALLGYDWTGAVVVSHSSRLDRKLLEKKFGIEAVEECVVSTRVETLRLKRRGDERDDI